MTAKKWVAFSRVRTGVPGIAKRSTYRESVTGRGLNQNWFALSASWKHLQTNLKWRSVAKCYSLANVGRVNGVSLSIVGENPAVLGLPG